MTLKFSTGLRDMINGLEGTVRGAIVGTGLTFVDGGGGEDSITDSGAGFISKGFAPGDVLFVQGAPTSGNDSGITGQRITSVVAGTITFATGSVANGEAGDSDTIVAIARGGSLKDIMKDGKIMVYSGGQPSSPDAAPTGTLLMEVTESAGAFVHGAFDNGLEFENDPLSGEVEKSASEIWQGVCIAAGLAGWFRFVANPSDAGGVSTVLPRIDGSVGISGNDINMPNNSLTLGATYTIDNFKLTLPQYYGA